MPDGIKFAAFSIDELKAEVERRAQQEKESIQPIPPDQIDWSNVIAGAIRTVDAIKDSTYYDDNDDEHYAWEAVMKAVYGKDYFTWHRNNTI